MFWVFFVFWVFWVFLGFVVFLVFLNSIWPFRPGWSGKTKIFQDPVHLIFMTLPVHFTKSDQPMTLGSQQKMSSLLEWQMGRLFLPWNWIKPLKSHWLDSCGQACTACALAWTRWTAFATQTCAVCWVDSLFQERSSPNGRNSNMPVNHQETPHKRRHWRSSPGLHQESHRRGRSDGKASSQAHSSQERHGLKIAHC